MRTRKPVVPRTPAPKKPDTDSQFFTIFRFISGCDENCGLQILRDASSLSTVLEHWRIAKPGTEESIFIDDIDLSFKSPNPSEAMRILTIIDIQHQDWEDAGYRSAFVRTGAFKPKPREECSHPCMMCSIEDIKRHTPIPMSGFTTTTTTDTGWADWTGSTSSGAPVTVTTPTSWSGISSIYSEGFRPTIYPSFAIGTTGDTSAV